MANRINRAIELLAQDQAIYYVGAHTGHLLTIAQGVEDSRTWADYINVGMEHGAFDMTGLAEYLKGLIDGGPTRSGHRAPTVIVEAPVNGTDAANVRFNAWQFRQILGRGVHGILMCQAESADAVRTFVESCRYPHHSAGVDPALPSPLDRMRLSLEVTGLLRFFEPRLFSASDVRHGKPAPDLFLIAAERCQVQPADCIVVEDSAPGVAAAAAAGMTPIGFVGGSHAAGRLVSDLHAAGARTVIADMRALKSTIADLRGW